MEPFNYFHIYNKLPLKLYLKGENHYPYIPVLIFCMTIRLPVTYIIYCPCYMYYNKSIFFSLKKEKAELELMRNDATVARDLAKAELEQQEKEIYTEKHKREEELQQMRKEAEETRLQQEKMERRNVRHLYFTTNEPYTQKYKL